MFCNDGIVKKIIEFFEEKKDTFNPPCKINVQCKIPIAAKSSIQERASIEKNIQTNHPTNELSIKHNIKPNELPVAPNNKDLIKQWRNTLSGKASAYALSRNDYFAAVTFIAEGVKESAFYKDPASGGKYGTLYNSHPGITMRFQSDSEILSMFGKTSVAHQKQNILSNLRGLQNNNIKTLPQFMKDMRLSIGDHYEMFNTIRNKYSNNLNKTLYSVMDSNPFVKDRLSKGHSKETVFNDIKKNMPSSAYGVLQHIAYKHGSAGKFKGLLNHSISAALDPENREKHLVNGASHIIYSYVNAKKEKVIDKYAMKVHRLFYLSGATLSPDLNMKILQNNKLDQNEEKKVNDIAQKVGIGKIIKNGKTDFGERLDNSKLDKEKSLDTSLLDKGKAVKNVNEFVVSLNKMNDVDLVKTPAHKNPPSPKKAVGGIDFRMLNN